MKRILSVLLAALLLLAPLSALAEEEIAPTHDITRAFVQLLNENGFSYTVRGVRENGDELVTIGLRNDACGYTLAIYFDDDQEHAYLRAWIDMTYDSAKMMEVCIVCTDLSSTYRYARFYPDTSDNSVTGAFDLIFRFDAANPTETMDIVWEALVRMDGIIEDGYANLAPYAVAVAE